MTREAPCTIVETEPFPLTSSGCVQCLLNRKVIFTGWFWPASPTPAPLSSLECQRCLCARYHICSLSKREGTLEHIHLCKRGAFFPLYFPAFKEPRISKNDTPGLPCNQPHSLGSLQIMKTGLWHPPFSESWEVFLNYPFGSPKRSNTFFLISVIFFYTLTCLPMCKTATVSLRGGGGGGGWRNKGWAKLASLPLWFKLRHERLENWIKCVMTWWRASHVQSKLLESQDFTPV